MTVSRAFCLAISAVVIGACVSPEPELQVGVAVSHLTASGPEAGLPPTTDTLRFIVIEDGVITRDYASSWAGLSDVDGDGSQDREAVIELPPDRPVSLVVHAKQATNLLATARIDNLEVRNGERRYVDLTFTPVDTITPVGTALPGGRFGHAAAVVQTDGRVLITGGFTVAGSATCPPQLPDAEACFQLVATNEAYLYNPTDGTIIATVSPMLRARALHTATSLGDGRILIAGGVSGAILGLERIGDAPPAPSELRPHIVPNPAEGFELSARTFEIFDPLLNAEAVDVGRDGDPQAGGFVGAPGEPTAPGQLNTPRFLHAATLLPGSDTDVMLAGGQGTVESSTSGEIFRLERAGGSGFQFPPTPFAASSVERVWPAAATTSDHVVVIGGVWPPRSAADPQIGPEDILERWSLGAVPTPQGVFEGVATCPAWQATDRPENALVGASALVFGRTTQRILVSGWLGPLCSAGVESYAGTPEAPLGACTATRYLSRSFTVGAADCSFGSINNPTTAHLLGPIAPLPDGGAIQSGGFFNGALQVTDAVDVLTGEFREGTNLALRDEGLHLALSRGRAWHTATPLLGGRVLFAGGMNFIFNTSTQPVGIELSAALEVFDPGFDPATAVPAP